MVRRHDPYESERHDSSDQQRSDEPRNLTHHQPDSNTRDQAKHGQRSLHPRRTRVARGPLLGGVPRFQQHARGMLGDIDVERGACEQGGTQDCEQLEYLDQGVSLPAMSVMWLQVSTLTARRIRTGSLLPELFGEPDENPFWTPDVAEPTGVFVLNHFVDELRATLAKSRESIVEVLYGEHGAQITECCPYA
jgi:hypothetical protein